MVTFFEALKFFLAAVIGFLVQIILSSDEFRQQFQRFAISAYRRISDIRYSVYQLRHDISRQRSRYPQDKIHEFDVIAVRAEEIERHVSSSEDDWKDFLKREIKALEEIDRRRDQIREIISSTSADDRQNTEDMIKSLRGEIRNLADSLPYSLKTLIDIEKGDVLPREGRHSDAVAAYLSNSIRENGFIRVPVDARGELGEGRIEQIEGNSPYGFYIDVAAGSEYFVIVGNDGSEIGLVHNPFPDVYEKDYYLTLQGFLPIPEEAYQGIMGGPRPIEIPGSEFDKVASQWDNHYYIKVPADLDDGAV